MFKSSIKDLNINFIGKGEVKGMLFQQLLFNDKAYLYSVTDIEHGTVHYEIFEKRINTRFNCVSYPTSYAFGSWAWTYANLQSATRMFRYVTVKIKKKNN